MSYVTDDYEGDYLTPEDKERIRQAELAKEQQKHDESVDRQRRKLRKPKVLEEK